MVNKKRGVEILIFVVFCLLVSTSIFPFVMAQEEDPSFLYSTTAPEVKDLGSSDTVKVSLYTGASVYNYGIDVPTGTNSLQPQINLMYEGHNSLQRPNLLGAGWSLSQSYVLRETNYSFANNADDSFVLVLNGARHKLAYNNSDKTYHTEVENFLKIENVSGGNNTKDLYWNVKTKDGTNYRFGFHNNSELVSNLYDYVALWSLDLVNDTYNNVIHYNYSENPRSNDNGTVYPDTVKYNTDAKRELKFIYESSDRSDAWTTYDDASEVKFSRRLKEINITANNNLIRRYVLEYDFLSDANSSSSIVNITQYGDDDLSSSLPITKFSYWDVDKGWHDDDTWDSPVSLSNLYNRLVDVNGDGLVDILAGTSTAYINNGSGWIEDETWTSPVSLSNLYARTVDVNGDGLTDILYQTTGAYINNGSGWVSNDTWKSPTSLSEHYTRTVDLNGDGLVDILAGTSTAYINNGSGWIEDETWTSPVSLSNLYARDIDVNGDGLVDILYQTTGAYINNGSHPYKLKNITNQYGGTISIDYKKLTSLDNTGDDDLSDLGFNLWVVANITEDNGMIGVSNVNFTRTYNYSGGVYEYYPENEFRGFNYAMEEIGDKKIEHWFHQNDACKGKEYETDISNLGDSPYKKIERTWNCTALNGYHVAELLENSELTYDNESSNPRIKNTTYSYDEFGNIVKIHHEGDITDTSDDRYEYFNFLNNSNKWVVDKIKNYSLFASDDSTKLRETFYSYDNLNYGDFPTKGSLTSKEDWADNGDNSVMNYSYDNYGNVVNETDSNNHRTEYIYGTRDDTFTFVDTVINAKGHTTNFNYDLGTGNLLWQVDSNGFATNYTYDVFGRITKEVLPYDSMSYPTTNYSYDFDGVAPETVKVSHREESGASNTLDEYSFYDGKGSLIQSKREAIGGKQIVTDIYYDELGRIDEQSNPYFVSFDVDYSSPNLTVKKIKYSYDQLDRVTEIINPDETEINISYDHWNITFYDENGNKIEYAKDAFEQIIEVRENNDAETYNTTYDYNSAGDLLGITDNSGNTFNFSFDSLGRKIGMDDPDLGSWDYSYDAVGNLIEQKDNRSIILTLAYDELDRITMKNSSEENITYTYDADKNNTISQIIINNLTINYSYDNRLRNVGELKAIDGLSFVTNWTYDSTDRVTSKTLPNGEIIDYIFDNQGLMSSITDILDIFYNERDQPIGRTYNNNLVTNYSYNGSNFRLKQIVTSNLQNLTYNYDFVGNIVKIDDDANSKIYSLAYDNLNRLTYANISDSVQQTEEILEYVYNPIGNLLQLLYNGENYTFYYGTSSLIHAPLTFIVPSNISSPLNDTNKFYVRNASNDAVAWLGDGGNIVLAGTCTSGGTCTAPVDSFTIKDSGGDVVAYIDSDGNLCVESATSCDDSDEQISCSSPNASFIVKDGGDNEVIVIDSTNGDLCLTGTLHENSNP